jgi:hypothetical protein
MLVYTGHAMAQLVEELRYELTDSGFDSLWVVGIFHRLNPSDRSLAQGYLLEGKGGRCIKLTDLPFSCADCLEILEPQPPGTLWACQGL